MLKVRVIGVVLVKDSVAVQSFGFRRYLPIGRPEIAIEYLDRWGIDEIVVLHMDAWRKGAAADEETVARYARLCQVPLAIGGGINDAATVTRIIQAGADKVVINSAALTRPDLVTEAAQLFGDQCVVVSIDARRAAGGGYEVATHSGSRPTGVAAQELARRAASLGAGEILINSIDCDGTRRGYELDLVRAVAQSVPVPVIACGGCGHAKHMQAAIDCGASAVAAANFFQHAEHSVTLVKRQLVDLAQPVRLDSYVSYEQRHFDAAGRLAKQDDGALDALRFRYIAEEVI